MVEKYAIRRDKGGSGQQGGGKGIIRAYRFLSQAHISLLTERRTTQPYGLHGGKPGKSGENIFIHERKTKKLPGKININAAPGDRLIVKTPGGGGWGNKKN